MRLASRRARLYESLRTAHLERAHELAPAAIVYRVRRYDFDESLAGRARGRSGGSPVRAALLLRRSRLEVLEINEPLMDLEPPGDPRSRSSPCASRRRRRPRIVTYAIGNVDPFTEPEPSFKRRVRWWLERILARYVWKPDRMRSLTARTVLGTSTARNCAAPNGMDETLIPALPARSSPPASDRAAEGRVPRRLRRAEGTAAAARGMAQASSLTARRPL